MDFKDLLNTKTSDIKQVRFPAGSYIVRIMQTNTMRVFYKASEKREAPFYGLAYVPSVEVVDVVPTGDAMLDSKQMELLERFGDWRGFKPPYNQGRFTYKTQIPGYEEKVEVAGIAPVNFTLAECTDESFETMKARSSQLTRFYNSEGPDGNPSGFVVETLSAAQDAFEPLEFDGDTLEAVMKATLGAYFIATYEYVQDNPQYEARLTMTEIAPVS